MIRKHPILITFLLLIIAGIAAAVINARRPKPTLIRVSKVERMDTITSVVSASGEIRAHEMVDIQTEVPGVITELPVIEGQAVKKGDILLRIDPFQARMEMASEEGRYAVALSEIKRVESTIATAQSNLSRQREMIKSNEFALKEAQITYERDLSSLQRYQELLKTKAISRDEYETFESKSRISAERVEVARSNIAQAKNQLQANQLAVEEQRVMKTSAEKNLSVTEAALNRARDQLKKTTINSPIDGVIVRLNVDIGERAVPGIQSNPQATLMTIANLSAIEAEIKVDETDIVRVALGQEVKITVDALSSGNMDKVSLKGRVTEIGAAPIEGLATGNNQEGKDFKVVAKVEAPPKTLRMGMLCDAEITIDTRKDVLAVPIQAMADCEVPVDEKGAYLPPPKPEKGKSLTQAANAESTSTKPVPGKADKSAKSKKKKLQGVFVKGSDGMAHYRTVKTGIMGESNIEILEGLKEGEEVITGPLKSLLLLDEWTLVKIEEVKP